MGRGNPELMALCDKLRDEDMVQLGVALDDQAGLCKLFQADLDLVLTAYLLSLL